MKNPKIFTIGGATFDIFVKAGDQAIMTLDTPNSTKKWLCLEHGGKLKVDHITETFGGGATNTAVGFSRMGFDVSLVAKIGSEYGDKVINNLISNDVDISFIRKTTRDKTAFSTIINTFDGDRTLLAYSGANRLFSVKDLPLKDLENADFVFLNHLTEKDSKIPKAIQLILKKNSKIKLAWNPGSEQLEQGMKKWKGLLENVDILFLNKEEASLFSNVPYKLAGIKKDDPKHHLHSSKAFLPPYADDVSAIMLEIFKTGVKNIVITDGKNGAQVSDGKRIYFCPIVKHKRVDTLGAGDAFSSGFSTAFILGKSLKNSLIYGTLNSYNVVSYNGAQEGLLTFNKMKDFLKNHKLTVTDTKLK